MTSLSPDTTPRRLSENRLSPIAADPIRTVSNSTSTESLRLVQSTPSETRHSNVAVPPEIIVEPAELHAESSSRPSQRPELERDDSEITLKQDVYRPEQPAQKRERNKAVAQYSDEKEIAFSDEKEVVVQQPEDIRAKELHSPPLTGKDSAYSSISGASFASPTSAHPRSASSQSSYPRAQFGLFPSSSPGTPKHSMSGRFGAMSPALSSPIVPDLTYAPQRAQTSLDNHNAPPRRLLKKSSLSSLKRLFSKKKHGTVDTIAE
jgi:hypothetical protein